MVFVQRSGRRKSWLETGPEPGVLLVKVYRLLSIVLILYHESCLKTQFSQDKVLKIYQGVYHRYLI